MAFHSVRFPLDVAHGARGGPERRTDVVTLNSGHEQRNQRWDQSRRRYNAGYGVKSHSDLRLVLDFFEERRGRFHTFLWRDALDHSSAANNQPPAPTDQPLGTGDGTTTAFQLVKRYGASFDPFDRKITKPDAASVRLAIDAVEVPSNQFTTDAATGMVHFTIAPAAGTALTAGFLFDVPVRFDTDRLEIELTGFDAAQAPAIPVVEVRE